jgi:Fur family ferric uptake transcriptional regulator
MASENATQSHYPRTKNKAHEPLSQRLIGRGIRLTPRRRALLEILEETNRHLDAAGLLKAAKQRVQIDRATVYRTLELLKKQGLVDELDLMHMRGEMHYYEARTGEEHFHLACFGCGQIEEIATPLFEQLKQSVGREKGFAIQTARLEIGGYCSDCASKGGKSKQPHAP